MGIFGLLGNTPIPHCSALGSVHTERVWTVGRREDDSQRWLLVARPMQTLVLELGNEMVETDQAGFDTARTTVAAGELADGALAVQVGRGEEMGAVMGGANGLIFAAANEIETFPDSILGLTIFHLLKRVLLD